MVEPVTAFAPARMSAYDSLPAEIRRELAYASHAWDAVLVVKLYSQAARETNPAIAAQWMIASIRANDEHQVTPLHHRAGATILRCRPLSAQRKRRSRL